MATRAKLPIVPSVAPQNSYPFEFFDLLGIDTYTPDEVASPNRCVYGRNFRLYAPNNALRRTAIAKRTGHAFYSVPVGETADQQLTSTTGAADQSVGLTTWQAQPYTAGANGSLTKIDIRLKNSSGTGPVIVAIYSDSSGPGTLLATSSVVSASITSSYAYISARFIEAPTQVSGTKYWVVAYVQSNGSSVYSWSSNTAATTAKVSTDAGNNWSSTSYALNIKTYVSTSGGVKGQHRFYRSTSSPVEMFAHGTNVYTVNDNTGAVTSIKSGLSSSATIYDWASVNDKTYFANGQDVPQVYNGSTVAAVGGSPPVADNVCVHTNSLWFLQPETNLLTFSEPGNYEIFDVGGFLYVPATKTADPVIKIVSVAGVLYCFTRNTKYLVFGTTAIGSGTMAATANLIIKESPGSKGAVSATAVTRDEESVYFVSDDFHVYSFNGAVDTKLSSERVAAFLRNVATTSTIKIYTDDKKLYVSYTAAGQSANTGRLVWDLVYQEWLSDEETYVGYGITWNSQTDTGQWVLSSSLVGALYYGDTGYNDLGKPIQLDWWSIYMSFGVPAAKHRIKRYYTFLQAETTPCLVDCQIDVDEANSPTSNFVSTEGAGAVWGAFTWGAADWGETNFIRTRIHVAGRSYKTQFRFVQNGVDTPVNLLGFSTYVQPLRPV